MDSWDTYEEHLMELKQSSTDKNKCTQLQTWPWAVSGFDRHGQLSILNSPNNPELPDRTVGARACAASTA